MKRNPFTLDQKRTALDTFESKVGIPLFNEKATPSMLALSIDEWKQVDRNRVSMLIEVLQLLKKGESFGDYHGVEQPLGLIKRAYEVGRALNPHHRLELWGHSIKAIASNIRKQYLDWQSFELKEQGLAQEGDLALVEVLNEGGSTSRVEDIYGRDQALVKGDKLMAVFGHRHTGTSEYGEIPKTGWKIEEEPVADLLCHGGIMGKALSIPKRMGDSSTRLKILGLPSRKGENLNLRDLFPKWVDHLKPSAPILAFCGTGAEIGKTTTTASFIKELKRRGKTVAATKLAGTGRYRDLLSLRDAGADVFMDFPDVGMPSTYTSPERYVPGIKTLLNHINRREPDVIVAEFGGDIIEANIPTFFQDPELRNQILAIVHASGDIMGMKGSLDYYKSWGIQAPIFLTQPKDRNHLGTQKRVEAEIPFPLFDSLNADQVRTILGDILHEGNLNNE